MCPTHDLLKLSRSPAVRVLTLAAGLLFFAAGCVTEVKTDRNGVPQTPVAAKPSAKTAPKSASPPPPIDPSITDPCATRLHDMCGEILKYYLVNHQLPPALEDLAPFADDGNAVYTCAITKKPYGYAPQGLVSAGQARRIIVYDPEPVHDGKRWVILLGEPKPGEAPWIDVFPLTDAQFKAYASPAAPKPEKD